MKIIASLLLMLSFGILQAQSLDETEIQKTIEQMFQDVFSNLDERKIPIYFTEDVQIFENGEIFTLDSIQQFVRNQKAMYQSEENKQHRFNRINDFDLLSTKIKDNQAIIGFYHTATFTMNDTEIAQMKWLESAILVRSKDGWKIEFLHSTILKN
ncbi:hypothetical protein [Moheibacter stercoris]|uniref:SnoaL-like domain-containing protein n=1 Tax=Moheibacter stercoris TaxID=1628251 RepID=A0ABV2LYP3_9FLAO